MSAQGEQEVALAIEALRKAMIDADKLALDILTADELSYGHSNGNVEDKKTFIESIAGGKDDFKSIELSEGTIKVIGDTAVARHRFKAEVVISGTPYSTNVGVLQAWKKEEGKWNLFARQAFKS